MDAPLVLNIVGNEVVGGQRFWQVSWRPRRWLQVGDGFTLLRRVSRTLALPDREWSERVYRVTPVDLVVAKYERQAFPGHACVQFVGDGAQFLRPPYALEDWRSCDELTSPTSELSSDVGTRAAARQPPRTIGPET